MDHIIWLRITSSFGPFPILTLQSHWNPILISLFFDEHSDQHSSRFELASTPQLNLNLRLSSFKSSILQFVCSPSIISVSAETSAISKFIKFSAWIQFSIIITKVSITLIRTLNIVVIFVCYFDKNKNAWKAGDFILENGAPIVVNFVTYLIFSRLWGWSFIFWSLQ